MTPVRRLSPQDRLRLRDFWMEQWGGADMVVHGRIIRYDQVDGYIYGDWTGLVTFILRGGECEIVSLDSLQQGRGIGTALIDEVIQACKDSDCQRLWLMTTNDNLHALGFYQRRGFSLVAVHRGAVDESRRSKPSIPLIGRNHIPLHDEIELEKSLR